MTSDTLSERGFEGIFIHLFFHVTLKLTGKETISKTRILAVMPNTTTRNIIIFRNVNIEHPSKTLTLNKNDAFLDLILVFIPSFKSFKSYHLLLYITVLICPHKRT